MAREMCAVSDVCDGICRKKHRYYYETIMVPIGKGKSTKRVIKHDCPCMYLEPEKEKKVKREKRRRYE